VKSCLQYIGLRKFLDRDGIHEVKFKALPGIDSMQVWNLITFHCGITSKPRTFTRYCGGAASTLVSALAIFHLAVGNLRIDQKNKANRLHNQN